MGRYMFKAKQTILRTIILALATLVLCPNQTTAAQVSGQTYMTDNPAILFTLLPIVLLLIGVLLELRKLRTKIENRPQSQEGNEHNIRLVGENLPWVTLFQLVYGEDKTLRFTYLSKGYEWVLGLDHDQALMNARNFFKCIHKEDIHLLQEAFRQGKDELATADIKVRVKDASGKYKWLHISAVPYREADEVLWNGFMQDASNAKRTEDALEDETLNFKNLFNTIDDFFLVWNANGKLLHVNPAVEQHLGYTYAELRNMQIQGLYPEDSRKEIIQITANIQPNKSIDYNQTLQTQSGHKIPVKTNIFQGSWKNKKAIFGIYHDISKQHQTEHALHVSQQMLQLVIDSIPMAIFWNDKESVYQGGNSAFIRECGLQNLHELVGKTPNDLFAPEIAMDIINRNQQVIANNQPIFNIHESFPLPDGSSEWLEISKIPLHREKGQTDGVLGIWNNVTDRKRADERLKCTLEDMARFNQLMRGRECRTLELKAEINNLLENQGEPPRYKTTINAIS